MTHKERLYLIKVAQGADGQSSTSAKPGFIRTQYNNAKDGFGGLFALPSVAGDTFANFVRSFSGENKDYYKNRVNQNISAVGDYFSGKPLSETAPKLWQIGSRSLSVPASYLANKSETANNLFKSFAGIPFVGGFDLRNRDTIFNDPETQADLLRTAHQTITKDGVAQFLKQYSASGLSLSDEEFFNARAEFLKEYRANHLDYYKKELSDAYKQALGNTRTQQAKNLADTLGAETIGFMAQVGLAKNLGMVIPQNIKADAARIFSKIQKPFTPKPVSATSFGGRAVEYGTNTAKHLGNVGANMLAKTPAIIAMPIIDTTAQNYFGNSVSLPFMTSVPTSKLSTLFTLPFLSYQLNDGASREGLHKNIFGEYGPSLTELQNNLKAIHSNSNLSDERKSELTAQINSEFDKEFKNYTEGLTDRQQQFVNTQLNPAQRLLSDDFDTIKALREIGPANFKTQPKPSIPEDDVLSQTSTAQDTTASTVQPAIQKPMTPEVKQNFLDQLMDWVNKNQDAAAVGGGGLLMLLLALLA